jgi:sulfur carrier protein
MSAQVQSIQIVLNGEPASQPAGLTVTELLQRLNAPTFGVAVERNRQVVRRADHPTTLVLDGDHIEIVTFVGGG